MADAANVVHVPASASFGFSRNSAAQPKSKRHGQSPNGEDKFQSVNNQSTKSRFDLKRSLTIIFALRSLRTLFGPVPSTHHQDCPANQQKRYGGRLRNCHYLNFVKANALVVAVGGGELNL